MRATSCLVLPLQLKQKSFFICWLHSSKKRHGIREIGEKLSGDQQKADDSQHDIEECVLLEDLLYEHIYNADETSLFGSVFLLVL